MHKSTKICVNLKIKLLENWNILHFQADNGLFCKLWSTTDEIVPALNMLCVSVSMYSGLQSLFLYQNFSLLIEKRDACIVFFYLFNQYCTLVLSFSQQFAFTTAVLGLSPDFMQIVFREKQLLLWILWLVVVSLH